MDLKKSFIIVGNVASGSTDIKEHPEAVPDGERWIIQKFWCADINYGNNKSSIFLLKFGASILDVFSVTGAKFSDSLNMEIIGNGTDKLSVERINMDTVNKSLPFGIDIIINE